MATRNLVDEAFLFSCAFEMVGDSMDNDSKRCFIDGDKLRCDEVDFQGIEAGREYVIKVNDTFIVRRVTQFDGECMTATPLNPAYQTYTFREYEIQEIYLIKTYQRKISEDTDL